MSNYGHFTHQYYGNKLDFPKESFLISGISYYQDNLENINFNSVLKMSLDPENKYDSGAIQILFNDKCIGYVPNNIYFKNMCKENINNKLKIINIKREKETNKKNYGIRVILDKYYATQYENIRQQM